MAAHVVRRGPLARVQYFEWWLSQCLASRAFANVFTEIVCPEGVSPQALGAAARLVLGRHETLRTTFALDAAGAPEQLVHAVRDLPPVTRVTVESQAERDQVVRDLTSHEFNLSVEMPVLAIIVLTRTEDRPCLLICCPHAVCDYHSMTIIRREIRALLEGHDADEQPAPADRSLHLLDIAAEEAQVARTRGETLAGEYWVKALSAAPLRNFWRSYRPDAEMYRAQATSQDAPGLLSRYACAHGSTPSIVYMAMVHIVITLLSGNSATLVRFYFSGRTRRVENTVGPFYRELFSVLRISDSDTISACVRQAAAVIMRARARYSLDYLSYREAEIREESCRGSAFVWGTIVNLVDAAEYRSSWRVPSDTLPAASCAELPYTVTPIGPDVNERGMEAFLSAVIEPAFMSVVADFNSEAVRPEDAGILVRGPWDMLRHCLKTAEDPQIAALREWYRCGPARPAEENAPPATGLRETELVLEEFSGVTASFVTARRRHMSPEIIAYVAADRPEITASELRDHVLAALRPDAAVICPSYFVICAAVAADRTSERSWRGTGIVSEGTGDSLGSRHVAHTASEIALLEAIARAHWTDPADPAKSYVEGGGTLLRVPAILQRLAEEGFTGLRARDFESHARLYQLARRLSKQS